GQGRCGRGDFVLQMPWNLAQTAVLMVLSIIALLGGLICLGRRRGAARVGGAFAVLAAVLPLTLPLLFPAFQMMEGSLESGGWTSTLLFVGVPSLVSASGLVTGLIAVILLAGGSPRGSRPPRSEERRAGNECSSQSTGQNHRVEYKTSTVIW